ncbi:MAG: 4Fe-4S binding protein [Anaerolineales bacterium]|nr:4Fe-4S binding protein [Anaerolineales bacterium]
MTREIRIQIQTESCRACRRCLAADVCKVRALMRMDIDEPPYIDVERCYDCRLCIPACPFEAIALKIIPVFQSHICD